jgi:hypothetical protein
MPSCARPLALLACACALASCQRTQLQRVLPPDQRVDVFPQNARAQLDALFVVDNARFMGPHQQKVSDSFHLYLGYLDRNQIDYHIGLLSTDVIAAPGKFQGGGDKHYFAAGDSDLSSALPKAVLALGDQGSTVSPTFQQLDLALRNPPAGFLRTGAALFLVSVNNDNDPWSPGDDLYYFRTFKEAKGAGNDALVTYSALAGDVPGGCSIPDPQNPGQSFFAAAAPRLQAQALHMGGLFHSVCDPSFDAVFDELGATAAGLKRTFRLAKIPDLSTLVVSVRAPCDANRTALAFCTQLSDECGEAQPALVCTPRAGPDGWIYDAPTNSLVFASSAVPPRASFIEAQYKERPAGTAP